MSDLLPCPFCGDIPKEPYDLSDGMAYQEDGTAYAIQCAKCASSGPWVDHEILPGDDADQAIIGTIQAAIAAWNTRQAAPVEARGEGMPAVVKLALDEVSKAIRKFPTWPTDPIHALAVLGEEYGELNKEVLQSVYEPHKTSPDKVRTEAIQTAAMALRFLASLDEYQYTPGSQHTQAALKPAPVNQGASANLDCPFHDHGVLASCICDRPIREQGAGTVCQECGGSGECEAEIYLDPDSAPAIERYPCAKCGTKETVKQCEACSLGLAGWLEHTCKGHGAADEGKGDA